MKNQLKDFMFFTIFLFASTITINQKSDRHPQIITSAQDFYFIRHGQTDQNIGKLNYDMDAPLNKLGQQQTEAAKLYLAKLPIKTICYSPLLRTTQTAEIITSKLKIPSIKVDQLKEMPTSLHRAFLALLTRGFSQTNKSVQEFAQNLAKGVEKALTEPTPVLIVAHGGVFKVICYLLNVVGDTWMIGNCEIAHFYKDGKGIWHVKKIYSPNKKDLKTKALEKKPALQA